jgi:hypothetical protein
MKETATLVILVSLLLITGCTSQQSPGGSSGSGLSLPMSADPLVQGKPLPMTGNITLGSGNRTFNVFIESIEVDPVKENGDQTITIYVVAQNQGTEPIDMVWFSKLTDLNGKTYGGIGISHNGNGARPKTLWPGMGDAARDYVPIRSDRDLTTLAKGAVLDVYFMNKISDDAPVSNIPDYHASWIIEPGMIH